MHILPSRQTRIVAWIAVIAALVALQSPAAMASPRTWEPMTLEHPGASRLSGTPINRLELLAIHNRKVEPIPFQVDEVSKDGMYVLPDGPESNAGDGNGKFDGDDQLVVMFSDFGDRRDSGSDLPGDAREITVTDPGGPSRYAYLAVVDSPRLSPRRYVNFDPRKDVIETDSYRAGLTNGLPTDFSPQSRTDAHGPNLIDRLKVRLSTRVLHLFPYSFSEGDISTRVMAWKAGPVRVIRRLVHSVNLIRGLGTAEVLRQDLFYRDFMEDPFFMYLPWAPKLFFGDIRVRIDLDFDNLRGYDLLWSGMTMPPIPLGDRKAEQKIMEETRDSITWMAIRGHGHMVVQALAPTPNLAVLNRRLYFNDDPKPDPPEGTPGEHPGIGYVITGWENLGSGTHKFDSLLITMPADYSADVLLEEMRTPPVVTVKPIADGK